MHVIETQDLRKTYQNGELSVEAVRGVDLVVDPGTFVAIMGPSGSGKSTLLYMLGGLEVPTAGRVVLEGNDLASLSDDDRTLLRRRRIGFIFQTFNLIPTLSARENVALPLRLDNADPGWTRQRAEEMLEVVGMLHRADHYPGTLSGGEQQRVAIARALAIGPALLLADEPTGNLDSANGRQITGVLRRLVDEHHYTTVIVTHDAEVAGAADRIVHLHDGVIERDNGQKPQAQQPAVSLTEDPGR
jgi:putative ABC transport system ATP-binding protein